MKIRTDFVTNSSSSSFTLVISFELNNGKLVKFEGHADGEQLTDYFCYEAIATVSPKQLGLANDIESLIRLLSDGVVDSDPIGEYEPGVERFVFKNGEANYNPNFEGSLYDLDVQDY